MEKWKERRVLCWPECFRSEKTDCGEDRRPVWCAPASKGCLLLCRTDCEESEDVCVYLLLNTATIGCVWVVPYYTRAYNTDISLFLVLQSMHLKIVHN